jgi:hypothetical protein
MLKENELTLLSIVKEDALADKVREISVLPFQSPEKLAGYSFTAPGVYLVFNTSKVAATQVSNQYSLLCVSKNARGYQQAIHGDGLVIGAYEIADRVMSIINHGSGGFNATTIRPLRDSLFDKQGLVVVAVDVENNSGIDNPAFDQDLNAFITFGADHLAADPDAPISQDEITLEQS